MINLKNLFKLKEDKIVKPKDFLEKDVSCINLIYKYLNELNIDDIIDLI